MGDDDEVVDENIKYTQRDQRQKAEEDAARQRQAENLDVEPSEDSKLEANRSRSQVIMDPDRFPSMDDNDTRNKSDNKSAFEFQDITKKKVTSGLLRPALRAKALRATTQNTVDKNQDVDSLSQI